MNRLGFYLLISSIFLNIFGCKKGDPCEKLVDGVYVYPKVPADHTWNQEQVAEYVNIPKDILVCISTPGLIESTMNYPYLGLIYAGANPQSGYDNLVKRRYRGLAELENRMDAAKCCLERYTSMNPLDLTPSWPPLQIGSFTLKFFYFEVIFSQFVILERLTHTEKITLVTEVIQKFHQKATFDLTENYWSTKYDGLILSARLMLMDNYLEFMSLYNSSEGVGQFTMFISPTYSIDEGEQIFTITQNYLNHLKTKNHV